LRLSGVESMVGSRKDRLTLNIKTARNIEDLAKVIEAQGAPTGPSWAGRIAEAVVTEGLRTAASSRATSKVRLLVGLRRILSLVTAGALCFSLSPSRVYG
jgi:hypothetical protein